MTKNMNIADRRLRAWLVAPVAVLIGIVVGPGGVGAIVLYLLAAIMLATSATGYCPLYSLVRLGSRRHGPLPR